MPNNITPEPETDLTDVIKDSLDDALLEPEVEPESTDADQMAVEETPVESASPEVPVAETSSATPAADPTTPEDAFAKEHGLPAQVPGGRENRIPYSRVKSIVEKAQKKASAPFQEQLKGFEAKVKDYEGKLSAVGDFEKVMVHDKPKFLQMLVDNIPGYREIFNQMVAHAAGQATAQPATPADPYGDMPQPDAPGPNGSKVYSMDGLKALMEWQAARTEARVTKQVSERYRPIEEKWQVQRQIEELTPVVNAQIAEARTWPQFVENEDAIVDALNKGGRSLSLEKAYQQVVYPKLSTSREEMRKSILAEMKTRPTSTAAPVGGAKAIPSDEPKSTEDIIRASIAGLKR